MIPAGVNLYGGFIGTETSRDQREPSINLSVLSGDIDNNDANATTTQVDASVSDIHGANSIHVMMLDGEATPIDGSTVIDGFTITGGEADGAFGRPTSNGGGLFCDGSGSSSQCNPTIRNVIFSGNIAEGFGGAVYSDGISFGRSSPMFFSVTFTGNSADAGGAIYNDAAQNGTSSPRLSQVSFIANSSTTGGAMMTVAANSGEAKPSLDRVNFEGNQAEIGGALYDATESGGLASATLSDCTFSNNIATDSSIGGGAIYNEGDAVGQSEITLTNCTFNANRAQFGGAIYNKAGSSSLLITNVTFDGNIADADGGGIYDTAVAGDDSKVLLLNTIMWGDSSKTAADHELFARTSMVTIDHSVVQGGCPTSGSLSCTNLFTTDPKLGLLAENGDFTRTMLPDYGSSAIDNGLDTICPPSDQRGVSRPQGTHCDIGAVEVIVVPPPVALPQSVIVFEGVSKQITLVGTDTNPGGPFSLSYAVTNPASHGAVFTGTGAVVTYTPQKDYSGPDSFDFTVTDVNGTSLPATVSILVIAGPPLVRSDNFYIPENTAIDIALIAQDNNAGGPYSFTFALASMTSHGTAALFGDKVRYTPDKDYVGHDQFTYTATDVNGTSVPGTMNITIHPGPVAQPRSITLPYNTSGKITFGATDDNGGPFVYTFALASDPAHGSLGAISGDEITYTPNVDFVGADSFTYTATDDNGTSVPALVSIVVLPPGGSGGRPPSTTSAIPALGAWGVLVLTCTMGTLAFLRMR